MCVFVHTHREPAQPAQSARLSKREREEKNLLKNGIIIAANKEKNETKNADVLT